MADQLTKQQETAVYDRGGKLLVSAAAGSGKTKVLVDRLMLYLMDPCNPANIDDFLIITFTEAAAAELRTKIVVKLNEKIAEDPTNKHLQRQIQRAYMAKISTVHAFCSNLLRDNVYRLDLSADFRMMDNKESDELRAYVVERVMEDAYKMNDEDVFSFIDTQGYGRTDNYAKDIILNIYMKSRCHLNPDRWLDRCIDAVNTQNIHDMSETIWGEYLIKDFQETVELLVAAMTNCVNLSKQDPDLKKATEVLESDLSIFLDIQTRKTWSEVCAARTLSFGRLSFPRGYDDEIKELIVTTRNRCKDLLSAKLELFADTNEQALQGIAQTGATVRGLIKMVRAFDRAYMRLKHQKRVVDFSDLEHMTLDLLVGKNRDTFTPLADEVGARFREVMVDEYQDSNEVQDSIFNALTRKRQNCFMVGDVKQSIYEFRLADPGIFIDKYNAYKDAGKAEDGEGRKVILSSNFRSSGGVIDAVNDVFSHYMSPKIGGLYYTKDEELNEGVKHALLDEPDVEFYAINVEHDRYAEEPAFVAERIKQLLDGTHVVRDKEGFRKIVPEDIVILLRSPGTVGMDYLKALERLGIRAVSEKNGDLLRTEEVIVMRSFLQCISNPLQDIPMAAVVTSRVIGMTANNIAKIRADHQYCSFYEALKKSSMPVAVSFCKLLDRLRRTARMTNISQLLDELLIATELDNIYGSMPDGNVRVGNIQQFCQMADSFEANGQGDLDRFLKFLDNLEADKGCPISDDSCDGAVRIMSIHKSKGLEFPVVFVCALSKGFNLEDTKESVVCDKDLLLGLYNTDLEQKIKYPNIARKAIINKIKASTYSEAMRILYVALTRPRDRLIMTYSHVNISKKIDTISKKMRLCPKEMMASEISSIGDWVLMTAMQRAESGNLFVDARRPDYIEDDKQKWHIDLIDHVDMPEYDVEIVNVGNPIDLSDTAEEIKRAMNYHYPFESATTAPSKLTATQLKNREDQYGTKHFRQPSFGKKRQDGRLYGNAMHAVMQHIRFENCGSAEGVNNEILRLEQDGIITDEFKGIINVPAIVTFFESDLGKRLLDAQNVKREFRFSILDEGEHYVAEMTGEKVLLQGVVDCALIEDDGITIIDFKSDRVSEETLDAVTASYQQQVKLYARAMERIYKLPVKATALYYFKLARFVYV